MHIQRFQGFQGPAVTLLKLKIGSWGKKHAWDKVNLWIQKIIPYPGSIIAEQFGLHCFKK